MSSLRGFRLQKLENTMRFVNALTGGSFVSYIADEYGGKSFSGWEVDKGALFHNLCFAKSDDDFSETERNFLADRLERPQMAHLSGGRTSREYAFDMLVGWTVEDLLAKHLRTHGHEVETVGDDSEREFLLAPSARPDWLMDGAEVECFVDFLGSWKKQGYMDVKPGKMKRLLAGTATMYCHDLVHGQGVILDGEEILRRCGGEPPEPTMHPRWNKETFQVPWN